MSAVGKQFFKDGRAHKQALKEVSIVVVVSMIPLVLEVFGNYYFSSKPFPSFWSMLTEATEKGKLFFFAFALFGTLLWLAFVKNGKQTLEVSKFLGIVAIIGALFAVYVYGIDPTSESSNNPETKGLSYLFYFAAVIFYYLLLVFGNLDPDEIDEMLAESAKKREDNARGLLSD